MDHISFDGKAVLVTGGGSGIGRSSAMLLASLGARVMVSDINPAGGEETTALIRERGGEAHFHVADVSKAGDVEALVDAVIAKFGRLDGAHNNAGAGSPLASVHDMTEADWDWNISVNLKSVWLCMRSELAHMARAGSGAIVNTSSVGAFIAVPGFASYSAAKAGVLALTRSAAIEYVDKGIRVNALCPGLTRTGLSSWLEGNDPATLATMMPPMKRMGLPDELASVAVFLLSSWSSYVTGQTFVADGGSLAI